MTLKSHFSIFLRTGIAIAMAIAMFLSVGPADAKWGSSSSSLWTPKIWSSPYKSFGRSKTYLSIPKLNPGRGRNNLRPLPYAVGPHTVWKKGPNNKITNYGTYGSSSRSPSGFQLKKRVDIVGKPHMNPDKTKISTPHVHEPGKKGVRPATPGEIPK